MPKVEAAGIAGRETLGEWKYGKVMLVVDEVPVAVAAVFVGRRTAEGLKGPIGRMAGSCLVGRSSLYYFLALLVLLALLYHP